MLLFMFKQLDYTRASLQCVHVRSIDSHAGAVVVYWWVQREKMAVPGFEPGSSGSQPLMLTTTLYHQCVWDVPDLVLRPTRSHHVLRDVPHMFWYSNPCL